MLGADAARRRWWWRRLAPASIVLAGLVMAEAYVRNDQHERTLARFYQIDSERGWALRPGMKGWARDESRVWLEINAHGFRDRERAVARPPRTLRVALLGDSFIESINVPLEQSFAALLEQQVGACIRATGYSAETLNFGVSGYNTAQELITYQRVATRYAPDIVMLAVYPDNDITGNHPELNPTEGARARYFALEQGNLRLLPASAGDAGSLMADYPEIVEQPLPWYQRARLALTNRSVLALRAYRGYAALRGGGERAAQPPSEPATIYQAPASPEMSAAWEVTEALIGEFSRSVRANGQEPWLVILANPIQTDPDVRRRADYARTTGVADLSYADRRLAQVAATLDLPVISLAAPMADYAARAGEHLHGGELVPAGTGHWNQSGNRLVARLVSDRLCAESQTISALGR